MNDVATGFMALSTNGNTFVDMEVAHQEGAMRFSSGLILPPPEIKCK
jgi:hypothetical protein